MNNISAIITSWLLLMLLSLPASADATSPTQNRVLQIMQVADSALAQEQSLKNYKVSSVSSHRRPTNPLLAADDDSAYDNHLRGLLRGKRYWLVYYELKQSVLGGDYGVFIESATDKVIFIYRGK